MSCFDLFTSLFGNESLTPLVYVNIRQIEMVTGIWLLVHYATSSVNISHVTEDTESA